MGEQLSCLQPRQRRRETAEARAGCAGRARGRYWGLCSGTQRVLGLCAGRRGVVPQAARMPGNGCPLCPGPRCSAPGASPATGLTGGPAPWRAGLAPGKGWGRGAGLVVFRGASSQSPKQLPVTREAGGVGEGSYSVTRQLVLPAPAHENCAGGGGLGKACMVLFPLL